MKLINWTIQPRADARVICENLRVLIFTIALN